jgi:DNA ligase-1
MIEYIEIKSMREAYEHFQEVTKRGDEGTVIKTEDMVWKDGTSKQQLKVKLVISAEVRVTGFIEGKKGTKRELTFGSLMFENDEGTIKGSTSGFNDEMLELINNNRNDWLNKVIEVEFNNITKSSSSETYAFSHPRFIADRSNEKTNTDTLETCLKMKEMAMNLK